MTEQQRRHREAIRAAELELARRQDLLDAYDLVLHDLREQPALHGHLPSLRSIKLDGIKQVARILAELRATIPP